MVLASIDILYLTLAAAVAALVIAFIWALVHFVRTADKIGKTVDEVNAQLTLTRQVIESIRRPIEELQQFITAVLKPIMGMGAAFKAAFDVIQRVTHRPPETTDEISEIDDDEE